MIERQGECLQARKEETQLASVGACIQHTVHSSTAGASTTLLRGPVALIDLFVGL